MVDPAEIGEHFAFDYNYPHATHRKTGTCVYFGRGADGEFHVWNPASEELLSAEVRVWLPEIKRLMKENARVP